MSDSILSKPAVAPKPVSVAPTPPLAGTYTVVKGDNLTRIASRNGTTVAELVRINGLKNANLINVGQVLKLR